MYKNDGIIINVEHYDEKEYLMKKVVLCLIAIALLLVFDVTRQEKDTIIIYSSMEQFRGEELQSQLNHKFPDMNVMVMYVSTAKSAAKIRVEGTGTDADIVVGLETSYLEKVQDSLADIQGKSKLDYVDGLTPEDNHNKYVTWERSAGAIIVNKKVLEKYGLEMPTSYDDLLKPEYKDLVAMPDPKSSSTGYFLYKNMVNTRGEEGALAYFDLLQNNIKQFTESGSGPIKLLIQGEIAVGLGLTFQAVNEINKQSPFEIIYPKEGSPFTLTGTALIKGREQNEKILEVYDFIINDFLVFDKMYYSPETILKGQENIIENYPKDIQYADMTGIDDIQEKERLLDLWKY